MDDHRARLSLLTHAPTAATAAAAFPADEPLDARGHAGAAAVRAPRADRALSGPERACRETCDVLGLRGETDDGLRGWDLGDWAGLTLDALAVERPGAVAAWLADPEATPHGGETLATLLGRVRHWIGAAPTGHTLAVCSPAIARAAVVAVLDAPPSAFWRVDPAPLTVTDLRGGPDRWSVRATGGPLRRR
jgi:broad specificity phosphatase PhoE